MVRNVVLWLREFPFTEYPYMGHVEVDTSIRYDRLFWFLVKALMEVMPATWRVRVEIDVERASATFFSRSNGNRCSIMCSLYLSYKSKRHRILPNSVCIRLSHPRGEKIFIEALKALFPNAKIEIWEPSLIYNGIWMRTISDPTSKRK